MLTNEKTACSWQQSLFRKNSACFSFQGNRLFIVLKEVREEHEVS